VDGFIIVHFQLPIADFLLKPRTRFFVIGFFLEGTFACINYDYDPEGKSAIGNLQRLDPYAPQ